MSLKALNSKALFSGSLKNIVACSPTFPLKRMQGFITNVVLLAFRLSAKSCQFSQLKTTQKCGTGIS